MITTAAAHRALATALPTRWLRVELAGLAVLDALEQSRLRPLAKACPISPSERGEDRLALGFRGLGIDRRGHQGRGYNDLLVTQITWISPLRGITGKLRGIKMTFVWGPAVGRKRMLQWKNARLVGLLVTLGSISAVFGNWHWRFLMWW